MSHQQLYAWLQTPARIIGEKHSKPAAAFVDSGSTIVAISDKLAEKLQVKVNVKEDSLMTVKLGYGQEVQVPKRQTKVKLQIPGFPEYEATVQVMPVPDNHDVLLGLPWLREMNPIIDWKKLTIQARQTESTIQFKPRLKADKTNKIAGRKHKQRMKSSLQYNYYLDHGHIGKHGQTKILSMKQFQKNLKKDKDIEYCIMINVQKSEKAERFKTQDWENLKDNPAYNVLKKYEGTVFRKELPAEIPPSREGIEHEIQLKPGTTPIAVSQWRQSPDQQKVIREWTKEMIQAGIIRPSTSAFAAPTFCVKKPVGWRIVHDYRRLNAATLVPAIPMPRKDNIFDAMSQGYWFSCMDLLSGYYQVKLRDSDIPYTAFSTPDGLFEYLVTPMGLSGSPGTFNRLLQKIFQDLEDFCRVYFDDMYVFTKEPDVQQHIQAIDKVLKRCEEQKLYIKLSKCQFCVPEIPCLGDFVGRNGVRMDPDKVKIIKEWPIPKTKRHMESFLGTAVYVSKFCKEFAQFAGPLHEALKGKKQNDKILLSDNQLRCFEELKVRLSSPPILKLPDFSKPFHIRMDASNFAIGGVLFQKEGELEYPISFTGRKMKDAELNYPVRQQELLAIMHALKVWRTYLIDKPFTVETDHKSIETILTQKTTNRRIARWFNELAEFQPQFHWIPGETNIVADALSRRPDFEKNSAKVSFNELIKAAQNVEIIASIKEEVSIEEQAKLYYEKDEFIKPIWEKLSDSNQKTTIERYFLENGYIYYKTNEDTEKRLVIPKNEDLRNRILYEYHDANTAGHPGYFKTYIATQKHYYWRNMHKDILRYVTTCEKCQRNKARQSKLPGLLNPLEIPKGRWTDLSMDFITSLPKTKNGYDTVLVIVDRLTKRCLFIPTSATATAKDIAQLFLKHYFKDHGIPKTIVSDRDPKFTALLWKNFMKILNSKQKLSSAFRPQTDGQTERTNRFIQDYLRGSINSFQNDWDDFINIAEFAYNSRFHSSIGMSPFEADIGYNPYTPIDVKRDKEFKSLKTSEQEFLLRQEANLKIAQDCMAQAQETMKYYYDRNRKEQHFKIGDLVLVDARNMDVRHKGSAQKNKLAPRYIGPFEVIELVNKDSYKLKLNPGVKLHPIFHTSLLKKYEKDDKRENKPAKVLLKDGITEGQLVEAIIGRRQRKQQTEYLVKWQGESKRQATWEPVANLDQVQGLIHQYLESKRKPGRPRKHFKK